MQYVPTGRDGRTRYPTDMRKGLNSNVVGASFSATRAKRYIINVASKVPCTYLIWQTRKRGLEPGLLKNARVGNQLRLI